MLYPSYIPKCTHTYSSQTDRIVNIVLWEYVNNTHPALPVSINLIQY